MSDVDAASRGVAALAYDGVSWNLTEPTCLGAKAWRCLKGAAWRDWIELEIHAPIISPNGPVFLEMV